MIKLHWILFTVLAMSIGTAETVESIFEQSGAVSPAGEIDRIVFKQLSQRDIKPVLCSDAVFVRRAYLDIIGKVPTAEEARRFIDAPPDRKKRSTLIDELLERPEYADYWAMKWSDVLRIKAEFPINLWPNAAQAYHHWVRTAIAQNQPYDQFVRDMLTSSGSNFRVGPVNFYRALQNKTPEGTAAAVALTFMGMRLESWPPNQQEDLAVFFSQIGYKPTNEWKEEIVFWDPLQSSTASGNSAPGSATVTTLIAEKNTNLPPALVSGPQPVRFPDGTSMEISPDQDPRAVFADWLIPSDTETSRRIWSLPARAQNDILSRCLVNRVWAWLLGRGIVHEPDDFREDNPPSNPKLLARLEHEFTRSGYDMKHLFRLILNSKTYQLSSVSNTDAPDAAAQFAAYPLRRLEAEVLIDAVNDITGGSDLYTSAIPEPFTYIPKDQSAVSIADGSITSSFLALFGRSARATGMANERNNQTSPSQWMHMLNSGHIQEKIEKGEKIKQLTSAARPPEEIIETLYLTILSRYPTEAEIATAVSYGEIDAPMPRPPTGLGKLSKEERRTKFIERQETLKERMNDWVDLSWALFNSPEFIYRH